ncbi:hypothetical protein RB195_009391 [Necator americanus]|uniref:Peptidase A2 domain-containing protein n=1 Tax=Necator americanus TaxID=51031 RepID=A0ABR1CWJ0_NECAM
MRVEDTSNKTRQGKIFLLTGALKALHPRTQELITLRILLDTGADRSFIDAKLAKELELPSQGSVTMKLQTFAAKTTKEIQCTKTCLSVWDSEGKQYKLRVYTHDNLTKGFPQGKLGKEDLQFIHQQQIKLSSPCETNAKPPEILIGCDQLWSFINFQAAHSTLPSGLILVPTRLGYMISGQRMSDKMQHGNELHFTIHYMESHDCEDPWERHWNIQSHDVEKEFCGPEKEEKANINAQVLENFNNTIARRNAGYVVRLPFKEDHEYLPDNKVLALHRLRSVLRKYQQEPHILQQYHIIFQDQIAAKILEEVDENKDTVGKMKHYLPHQSIYDPLGWFIPLLVKAKRFQQILWKEQYDWDEPLNEEHRRQWKLITMKISNFHKKVPRKVTVDNSALYTLVTYSDASGIAMTACTYLTSQRESSFLMAKSKVADSNRPTTVPKLEINAITIGARLTLNTFLSLKSSISINNVIFLTDSEIVLNWLKGSLDHPKTGPYVKNRIRETCEIRDIVQSLKRMEVGVKFGYIDTKWNPADIGTRGASNHEFVSHMWWDGYYLEKILNDGFTSTLFSLVKDPELQNDDILLNAEANVIKTHANTDKVEEILDLTRYNTKTKPLRILAYVIKFLRRITTRLKSPLQERLRDSLPFLVRQAEDQELTATDIFEAHSILIRNHQQVHLHSHYKKQLSKNLNLTKDTSERASTYTRKSFRQKKEHAEKERSEQLDERRARIEEFLRYNREVPERKIRRLNYMRSEERFLTCSFCLARGEHYSDSYPEYATVDTRSRRARCVLCLDSRHDTEHCWSKGKACMYCGSTHHNKALCALPETINKRRKELEKVREELQTLRNHQNRQPGPSNSQHWGGGGVSQT